MKETFQKVKGENGKTYILHIDEDTEITQELSAIGRVLFKMMKEQQPERLKEMREKGQVVHFLNKVAYGYDRRVQWKIQAEHMKIYEAEEMEWPRLMEEAGLN